MNESKFNQSYKNVESIARNYQGGRFTYKAIDSKINQPVIIKQFRFAISESDWESYKHFVREIGRW